MKSKIVATVVGVGIIVTSSIAADGWIADQNGCKTKNSHPVPNESIIWNGDCKDGYLNGNGILQWLKDAVPGTKIEANFIKGIANGKTKIEFLGGNKYDGNFIDGKMTGKGTFVWTNGNKYEGDFIDGKRTGKGTFIGFSGNRYEGDFINDEMTGKGTFIWVNGNRYEGDFKDNKRTGKGTFIWINGAKYEGDFVDGKMTGKGIFVGKNGNKYEGDFINDRFTGKGKFSYDNGDIYEGAYVDGNRTGKGILIWKNGDKYEGDFLNGKRTGKGILVNVSGSKYEGEFLNNDFHGKGSLIFENGSKYIGDFINGKRTGKGISVYLEGAKYEGEYLDGKKSGYGILWCKKENNNFIKKLANKGAYEGNLYVLRGEFRDNEFVRKTIIPENLQKRIDSDSLDDFKKVQKTATLDAYKQFLEDRPNSSYKQEILTLMDKKIEPEYQKAKKAKNISVLQAFADNYPFNVRGKDALADIQRIKEQEQERVAAEAARKFNELGRCEVGETVYNRETWDSTTSSGNILADALFGAATKESFIIEFEGIVKGFIGKKVEVYVQDYAIKQTRGGGIFQPVTGVKGRIAEYADKKVGKSYFYDRSRCSN